jgi:hypothetical protein
MSDKITPASLGGLRVDPVRLRPKTINVLVYGDSGVGKTVFAGSSQLVPEMTPVLLIDIEGGALSLTHTYPEVDVVRVQTWDEMQGLYNELHAERHKYKTVILDSLTEIQKFSMYNIMKEVVDDNPERDPDIAGMREWGKNIEQMRRYVRAFRDLPINTIFTALAREDKDNRGQITKKPSLSGKLAGEVAAFLDIVLYYYVKNVKQGDEVVRQRLMLTSATDTTTAKDRTGKLPLILESPTMSDIYSAVIGHQTITGEPLKEQTA